MTSIVGVRCRDGVVIGADSAATFGDGQNITIAQPTEKLAVIGEHIVLAGTGDVGLDQRFRAAIKAKWDAGELSVPAADVSKILCRAALEDFISTRVPSGQYGALVAFPAENRAHLVEYAANDFQPEFKDDRIWYGSMGIAQAITDTLLSFMREVFWAGGPPSLSDGIFAVTWTLDHAVAVAPQGVAGPVRLAILSAGRKGCYEARMLSDDELMEHRQNVSAAKDCLQHYKDLHKPAEDVPEVPTP